MKTKKTYTPRELVSLLNDTNINEGLFANVAKKLGYKDQGSLTRKMDTWKSNGQIHYNGAKWAFRKGNKYVAEFQTKYLSYYVDSENKIIESTLEVGDLEELR